MKARANDGDAESPRVSPVSDGDLLILLHLRPHMHAAKNVGAEDSRYQPALVTIMTGSLHEISVAFCIFVHQHKHRSTPANTPLVCLLLSPILSPVLRRWCAFLLATHEIPFFVLTSCNGPITQDVEIDRPEDSSYEAGSVYLRVRFRARISASFARCTLPIESPHTVLS